MAFYDGHIDVFAESEEAADLAARWKLKRGTFPDYPWHGWKITRIEAIENGGAK
jgi:hypothetical protein